MVAQKFFVLDTNILMTSRDALKFNEFGEDNIKVIPQTVITELENNKHGNNQRNAEARASLKILSELSKNQLGNASKGNLDDKFGIEGLRSLASDIKETNVFIFNDEDNDFGFRAPLGSTNDDRIALVAKYLNDLMVDNKGVVTSANIDSIPMDDRKYIPAILITNDTAMQTKSNIKGLNVECWQSRNANLDTCYKEIESIELNNEDAYEKLSSGGFVVPELDTEKYYMNQPVYVKAMGSNGNTVNMQALVRPRADGLEAVCYKEKMKGGVYGIRPKTPEQEMFFQLALDDRIEILSCIGISGSGKTLLSMAAGLKGAMDDNKYDAVWIIKNAVPMGKATGFVPGTYEEKVGKYLLSVTGALDVISENGRKMDRFKGGTDGYNLKGDGAQRIQLSDGEQYFNSLVEMGKMKFMSTEYLRGGSIRNKFIIVDEVQNMEPELIKSIITRCGEGTKLVLLGDIKQVDHAYLSESNNGLAYVADCLTGKEITYVHIYLGKSERADKINRIAKLL